PCERLERIELEPVEIVEAVDEHRRPAPPILLVAQRVEGSTPVQLLVQQSRRLEAIPVRAVDRRDLLRVLAARPLAGPVPQRAGEAGGTHLVTGSSQLGEETSRGAHEAGLCRGLG